MNKDSQKTARNDTGAAPAVHDLRGRVPLMADDALASLRVNALRLKETGNAIQRNSATELLPVVDAELADRKEKKKASMPPKAPRATKKKPAVKKAAGEDRPEREESQFDSADE
jgi:hypothetical protein